MKNILIKGPSKLSGKVKAQGAKNSAMKHIFIPLITNDTFVLENIPRIGSTEKHTDILKMQGAKLEWSGRNTLIINTKNVIKPQTVPKELLYFTSDANKVIPILASKFGKCLVEIDPERSDRGGDQIGSRRFNEIIPTLKEFGIGAKYKNSRLIEFYLNSKRPFKYKSPVSSFTISVLALFSALFKKGKSQISNFTLIPEFDDIVEFLIAAGAKITKAEKLLQVFGPVQIKGITYKNMYDPHDLVTWISAALTTNSKLTIEGIEYEKMKLQTLERTFDKMNIGMDLHKFTARLNPQLTSIKPLNIYAGQYPLFTSEWQVLISPLLTQIQGKSEVIETIFANRMQHWNEMAKMGVKFEFFKDPKYPEVDDNPRAVKVTGPQKLYGAKVDARDVRTGAALVIAGLAAKGKTEITNTEHIERGYENLVERLKSLGANINYL
ncbi:MAG: UDP-N-acetylglucosamine 1-carboxyvinyltransferase [Candidatus Woesebacteria bacterium GW2011_GWB1_39_12]|uniref:UDP-N-acetylglucosamine 1-carboxyvinyltransferase n=2 Tax=Candidatus Woeseibacteriota TaxID=1752722 RepID=A0A0G0M216_9BACT|nr:MAG: UDP-N-acetylglucosamine 1-carboxyvinyltransferase [Candidatus Woesebacteria bacterium GW2011_GWA1_39_12]KKR00406.1 MAG: UDP-N-acetylglucosamine 1-carboxyvinyltransferase [Candidatus Woesebacteria bacterium GW2011_GWB1_39_12]